MQKWIFRDSLARLPGHRNDAAVPWQPNPPKGGAGQHDGCEWARPASVAAIQTLMADKSLPERCVVCPVGARCSFSVVDEPFASPLPYLYVDTSALDQVVQCDEDELRADVGRVLAESTFYGTRTMSHGVTRRARPSSYLWRVGAGARLSQVTAELKRADRALPNLGQVLYQSVAGAVQTGTHGSGAGVGNLATAVAALDVVTADGLLVRIEPSQGVYRTDDMLHVRDDDIFRAAVVGLGCFGVIVAVTFAVVDLWTMRERRAMYTMSDVRQHLGRWLVRHDHVELLINPHAMDVLVVTRDAAPLSANVGCSLLANSRRRRGVIFGIPRCVRRRAAACSLDRTNWDNVAANITLQLRLQADQHYEADCVDVLTNALSEDVGVVSSECAVPVDASNNHIRAIDAVCERLRADDPSAPPLNLPVNVRFARSDTFPLSANCQDATVTCFIETPCKPTSDAHLRRVRDVERLLVHEHAGRPHPGKVQGQWDGTTLTFYGAQHRRWWLQWHKQWVTFHTALSGRLPHELLTDYVRVSLREAGL